ncbi:MAG: hypothetical protein KC486_16275 [Myxococcales bacterium]|nr:hypothetical protein [Myxococcales bacterium]
MSVWEPIDAQGRVRRWEYAVGASGRANAVAVELRAGELLLLSPPGPKGSDEALAALDEHGEVAAIVAPNGFHRGGLPAATERYPSAGVYADPRAAARVGERCARGTTVRPLTALTERLPDDVELFVPEHMKRPDVVMRVAVDEGLLWSLTDIVLNLEALPPGPIERRLFALMGFRPGLAVNYVGSRLVLLGRGRSAYSAWLCAELRRRPPALLITGHGPPVRDPEALRELPALVAAGMA